MKITKEDKLKILRDKIMAYEAGKGYSIKHEISDVLLDLDERIELLEAKLNIKD